MGVFNINVGAKANIAPVANAGTDQIINQPATTCNLNGSSSYDPDGSIVSYAWTKTSGPACTITSPSTVNTSVTGMSGVGVYIFQLLVTDNGGLTNTDTVQVTINAITVYTPIWVVKSADATCVLNGHGYPTGYKQYPTLYKISNDGNAYPLDINNNKTADSGLSQVTKANTFGDPNYVNPIQDLGMCPLPGANNFQLQPSFGFTMTGVIGTGLPTGVDTANATTTMDFDILDNIGAQNVGVELSGTVPGGLSLKLNTVKNGVSINCQAISGTGTITVPIPSLVPTDLIQFQINSGVC